MGESDDILIGWDGERIEAILKSFSARWERESSRALNSSESSF